MIGKWIKVIDRFMESVGLYEKVYWKLLDPLVRETTRERAKWILKNVYKFEDIDLLFPASLDKEELRKNTQLLMQNFIQEEKK